MELEALINDFDEILYIAALDNYELLYMNEKCQRLTGETAQSYAGKKCYHVLQNSDTPCSFCTNALLSTEQNYQWEFKNPHLNRYYFIKDKIVSFKGRKARIEFAIDITDYKQQTLRAESRMSTIIDCIPGGLVLIGCSDTWPVLWYNEGVLEILGYTREQFDAEVVDGTTYWLPEDVSKVLGAMEEAKASGESTAITLRVRRRDGEIRTLITTLSYYADSEYTMPVFYSIGIDITDYTTREEQDRQALQKALDAARDANTAKSRFLSRMSHEIRTPLNAVIGMASIASASMDKPATVRECHKKIESAAQYLLSLINDILDVSRIESGKLQLSHQDFRLPDFLHDIVSLFTLQAKNCRLHFEVSMSGFEEEYFWGDPLHLKQVIVNLLSNAFKFTEPGGTVTLCIKALAREAHKLWLEISVEDTGIGIQAEALDKVFEVFEQENSDITSRFGGSGLGLTISKHIVELMGGSLEVRSTEGQGSTFTATIPLELQDPQSIPQSCPHVALHDFSGKNILVVEDNDINMEITVELLKSLKIHSELAYNGQQALDMFCNNSPGHFDAILMDIRMPIMDGLTATQKIRALDRPDAHSVPIIALSANAFEEDKQRSHDSGMNAHIAKPIDIKELRQTLGQCL